MSLNLIKIIRNYLYRRGREKRKECVYQTVGLCAQTATSPSAVALQVKPYVTCNLGFKMVKHKACVHPVTDLF